jgi:hypothetical protein
VASLDSKNKTESGFFCERLRFQAVQHKPLMRDASGIRIWLGFKKTLNKSAFRKGTTLVVPQTHSNQCGL